MRARSRLTFGAVFTRFRDGEQGTSAVEFALVAPLFLTLLIAISELSMIFFSGQYLETAVQDSARLIMTGHTMEFGRSLAAAQYVRVMNNRQMSVDHHTLMIRPASVARASTSAKPTICAASMPRSARCAKPELFLWMSGLRLFDMLQPRA